MRRLRTAAALTTALAASLVLAACGGTAGGAAPADASHTPDPAKPQVLKWAHRLPGHWDPVVSGSGAQFRILSLVYASLTEIDENGNAAPGLAESWDYNDDRRPGDLPPAPGPEVQRRRRRWTPTAVKLYLERAKTQENSALFGDLDLDRVGRRRERDRTSSSTSRRSTTRSRCCSAQRVAQITSPEAAKDPAKLDQCAGRRRSVRRRRSCVPGSHAVLVKNPDYWDAANIHIDEVELSAAPDPATVVSGIQTGVYDFADLAPEPGRRRPRRPVSTS